MEVIVRDRRVRLTTGGRPLDRHLPLLVFIHGAGTDRTMWVLQTRYFATHGWSVVAVDLPGHGGSEGPAVDTVEELVAWTADLVAETGWSHATIVGQSLGSAVALQLAADHPDLVTGLVLVAIAAALPVNASLLEAAEIDPPRAWDMVMLWSLARSSQLGGHPTPGLWMRESIRQIMATAPRDALHTSLRAADGYRGGLDAAIRVTCPTLLLLGEEDRMVPCDTAEPLAHAIAHSKKMIIPDAGHQLVTEQPDVVLNEMAEFLKPLSLR